METIKEELADKQYIRSIILQIYTQMQKCGIGKGNRPTALVIGKREFEALKKLNLDWQRNNDNPVTLMGFKLEIVDKLDISNIKLK